MRSLALYVALTAVALPVLAQNAAPAAPAAPESAASRLASAKIDKDQLSFNIESVLKLLTTSSAAKQIETSKAPEALSRRDKAVSLQKQAKAALDAGDLSKASSLLTETRAVFFDAVRFAAPEEVRAKKLEADYNSRLESVKALLAAYQRVANEKGSAARGVKETVAQIEKSLKDADDLAKVARFQEGRTELDRAYLVAKAGISSLRSGDTLVRSLNFANKEEEYHYEVDRNNTHLMLLKVLVEERKAGDQMVQTYITKAQELRTQADTSAAKKDYESAIKLLEDSTAELVRAIRNAGIYIPS